MSLIIFIICLCLPVTAFAEDTLSVWAQDVEVKNNRLFQVDIYAESNVNLASSTFNITYDTNILEYRDVDTDISKGKVKAIDNNGKIKAVFLKNDGIENGSNKIFSLEFKSIKSGSAKINIEVYDCVNNSIEELSINTHTECTVTVTGRADTSKNNTNTVISKENKNNENKNSSTEKASGITKYLSVATPDSSAEQVYLLIIFVLIIIIIFFAIKTQKQKTEKKKTKALPTVNIESDEKTNK